MEMHIHGIIQLLFSPQCMLRSYPDQTVRLLLMMTREGCSTGTYTESSLPSCCLNCSYSSNFQKKFSYRIHVISSRSTSSIEIVVSVLFLHFNLVELQERIEASDSLCFCTFTRQRRHSYHPKTTSFSSTC